MRRNTRKTNVTLRFVECLQVGAEQFIIEIRPAFTSVGGLSASNKWMNAEHWSELYEILQETAHGHLSATEKYYDVLKAQGVLLKVLYQFQPIVKYYQDVLTTYTYHSEYPQLALKATAGFLGAEPYRNILVAVVYPGGDDVYGLNSIPTYWEAKPQNKPGKSVTEHDTALSLPSNIKIKVKGKKNTKGRHDAAFKEQNKVQELESALPGHEVETEDPDNEIKGESKSCSALLCKLQEPTFDVAPDESDEKHSKVSGGRPLRCKEVSDPEPEICDHVTCLTNSPCQESPDMFDSIDSIESNARNQSLTGGCPRALIGDLSSTEETNAQLEVKGDMALLSHCAAKPSDIRRKFKRNRQSSSSSAEEGSVNVKGDGDSQISRNLIEQKKRRDSLSARNCHKSTPILKCAKQTKSKHFDPECEGKSVKVLGIEDTSREHSPANQIGDLHGTVQNANGVEMESESEVVFVNRMPPISEDQRRLLVLHEANRCTKKREERDVDVDEEILNNGSGNACDPPHVKSPISSEQGDEPNKVETEFGAVTKHFVLQKNPSSESSSDEELVASEASSNQNFSKFEFELKTSEDSLSSSLDFEESGIGPSDQDLGEQTQQAQSMLSVVSNNVVEKTSNDCSATSMPQKINVLGTMRTVPSKKTATKTYRNSKTKTNVKSSEKKADSGKLRHMQPNSESSQPRVQRSSPRKVPPVCYAENDEKKPDAEISEAVMKRASPRKKARLKNESKPALSKKLDGLTDDQKKLLALHLASKQARGAGVCLNSRSLAVPKRKAADGWRSKHKRGSDAQRRVRLSQGTKEKQSSKDQPCNQITNYFGSSKKRSDFSTKTSALASSPSTSALTSASVSKSKLMEEERRVEALSKVLFPSDDDNDSSSGPDEPEVPDSRENDIENARCVKIIENVSLDEITKSFKKHGALLHGIFKEKIPCERHALYKAGERERTSLRYSTATNPFSDKHLSHMMDLLTKTFCRDNPLHFIDYMWKVLIPELANHVFMDQFNLDYEESLKRIHELYIFSNQDSD